MESFIKWAGGKRWLVKNHWDLFPENSEYNKYVEPFLGGGSIFFSLEPNRAIINDINKELITTYNAIKKDWRPIYESLRDLNEKHDQNLYYDIRSQSPINEIDVAIRFLYLNRTCWNGLYRVNRKNQFNVPIGTKTKVILDTDDFEKSSRLLSNAEIYSNDFEDIISKCAVNDFLFVDPPYTVKHNLNGFIKYNENLFTWDDQVRLREAVGNALNRGVKVLVLNADHESIRDLYHGIGEQFSLSRASVIAGNKINRGVYTELAVKCY